MTDQFNGFPAGELKFTQIPDLFFSRLLPQIDDLSELKVTLHFMWLHQREKKQVISLAELQADEPLILGLTAIADDPFATLQAGLNLAVKRKTLLYAHLSNTQAEYDLYFLNSARGRQAFQELEAGELGLVSVKGVDLVSPHANRPNIFELYEANISLITPIIADELKDAQIAYPAEWVEKAFKLAVENNVRRWTYIRAILEKMATEGADYDSKQTSSKTEANKRWFTQEELEQYFER